MKPTTDLLVRVVRWLVLLPCALISAYVCWYLVVTLNRVSLPDPDAFVNRLFVHVIGSAVVGTVLVYVSVFIAPSHKWQVAVVVAGLMLLASGALILVSLLAQNYWAVFNNLVMDVAAVGMALSMFTGRENADGSGSQNAE